MNNKKLKQNIIISLVILQSFIFVGCQSSKSEEIEKSIEDFVSEMTLDEKIGQMIVTGFNGTDVNEEITKLVNENKIGGSNII